jgi:hypothetical protein
MMALVQVRICDKCGDREESYPGEGGGAGPVRAWQTAAGSLRADLCRPCHAEECERLAESVFGERLLPLTEALPAARSLPRCGHEPSIRGLVRDFIRGRTEPFRSVEAIEVVARHLPDVKPDSVRAEITYATREGLLERRPGGILHPRGPRVDGFPEETP